MYFVYDDVSLGTNLITPYTGGTFTVTPKVTNISYEIGTAGFQLYPYSIGYTQSCTYYFSNISISHSVSPSAPVLISTFYSMYNATHFKVNTSDTSLVGTY